MTLPGRTERRLFKSWANNNVPGKKGFQPKSPVAAPSAAPTTAKLPPTDIPGTSGAPGVKLDEIGGQGIQATSKFDRTMGRKEYAVISRKAGGRIGYYIEAERERVLDGGWNVRGVHGDVINTVSTVEGVKSTLARSWNSGGTPAGRSAALAAINGPQYRSQYSQSPLYTSVGHIGTDSRRGRQYYRVMKDNGEHHDVVFNANDGTVSNA